MAARYDAVRRRVYKGSERMEGVSEASSHVKVSRCVGLQESISELELPALRSAVTSDRTVFTLSALSPPKTAAITLLCFFLAQCYFN